MKVRLTRDYTPPPEWGQHAYRAGLIVTGDLAALALKDGAGVFVSPDYDAKIIPPLEAKRRGRPPKVEAA
jgi:hypothetical protein